MLQETLCFWQDLLAPRAVGSKDRVAVAEHKKLPGNARTEQPDKERVGAGQEGVLNEARWLAIPAVHGTRVRGSEACPTRGSRQTKTKGGRARSGWCTRWYVPHDRARELDEDLIAEGCDHLYVGELRVAGDHVTESTD